MDLISRIKNSGIYAKAKAKIEEWDTRKLDEKLEQAIQRDIAEDPYHRTVYELFTKESDFGDIERYEQIRQWAGDGRLKPDQSKYLLRILSEHKKNSRIVNPLLDKNIDYLKGLVANEIINDRIRNPINLERWKGKGFFGWLKESWLGRYGSYALAPAVLALGVFGSGVLDKAHAQASAQDLDLTIITQDNNGNNLGNVAGTLTNSNYQVNETFNTNANGSTFLKIKPISTSIADIDNTGVVPREYNLISGPNPSGSPVTFFYSTPKDCNVSLIVVSVSGQKVAMPVVNERVSAGNHSVVWDGRNFQGLEVADGFYVAGLVVNGRLETSWKMTRLKGIHNYFMGGSLAKPADFYQANSSIANPDSISLAVKASKKDPVLQWLIFNYQDSVRVPFQGSSTKYLKLAKVNQPPVFRSSLADTSVNVGDTLAVNVRGITYDANSDELIFSFEGGQRLRLVKSDNGYLTFVADSSGIDKLVLRAFDGQFTARDTVGVNVGGVKTKPIAPVTYNEDIAYANAFNVKEHFIADGIKIDRYEAVGFSNVKVEINQDGSVNVGNKTENFNGSENGFIRAYYGGKFVEIPLEVRVNSMDDLRGKHIDNDTEQGKKARITVDGVAFETDSTGLFDFQVAPKDTHTVYARTYDEQGNPNGYRRTQKEAGNRDVDSLKVYSVSYPTQEGITPELFILLCEQANFRELWGYEGLKTMLKNPNKRFWVSSHGDSATYAVGGKATAEEQAYVVSLIESINAHLKTENKIPIYVENPNNIETIPATQDGIIAVIPRVTGTWGIGAMDKDKDGVLDWGVIYLESGEWKEANKGSILQELLSAYVAPREVPEDMMNDHRLDKLTVLRGGNHTDYLTQMDIKLLKIGENYKPLEQKENILGM